MSPLVFVGRHRTEVVELGASTTSVRHRSTMARTKSDGTGKGINKSQAIRDVLAQYPKTKTKEVVAKLAEQGIKVTTALVYLVKSKQKDRQRRQKREKVAEASRQTGSANPVRLVIRVKELARDVGSYKSLKQLVDLLAE
jgi:hypothetical protein